MSIIGNCLIPKWQLSLLCKGQALYTLTWGRKLLRNPCWAYEGKEGCVNSSVIIDLVPGVCSGAVKSNRYVLLFHPKEKSHNCILAKDNKGTCTDFCSTNEKLHDFCSIFRNMKVNEVERWASLIFSDHALLLCSHTWIVNGHRILNSSFVIPLDSQFCKL